MIDRFVLPVCLVVVIGWMLLGCSDGDFTVAQPLTIETDSGSMGDDASDDAVPTRDTIDPPDAPPDTDAPDASPPDVPPPDTLSDTLSPPLDTHPGEDSSDTLVSTPGTVACTSKPAAACAAFVCDESADCGGARCCLRPDGAGSTCDCSGASMDSWTVLCLTEGDCYGGKHCTPWAAWDHHGRCL